MDRWSDRWNIAISSQLGKRCQLPELAWNLRDQVRRKPSVACAHGGQPISCASMVVGARNLRARSATRPLSQSRECCQLPDLACYSCDQVGRQIPANVCAGLVSSHLIGKAMRELEVSHEWSGQGEMGGHAAQRRPHKFSSIVSCASSLGIVPSIELPEISLRMRAQCSPSGGRAGARTCWGGHIARA